MKTLFVLFLIAASNAAAETCDVILAAGMAALAPNPEIAVSDFRKNLRFTGDEYTAF